MKASLTALVAAVVLANVALAAVMDGCTADMQAAVNTLPAYKKCKAESGFEFSTTAKADASAFCASQKCLKLFKRLRKIDAVSCTAYAGLDSLALWVKGNPKACFHNTPDPEPDVDTDPDLTTAPATTTPTPTSGPSPNTPNVTPAPGDSDGSDESDTDTKPTKPKPKPPSSSGGDNDGEDNEDAKSSASSRSRSKDTTGSSDTKSSSGLGSTRPSSQAGSGTALSPKGSTSSGSSTSSLAHDSEPSGGDKNESGSSNTTLWIALGTVIGLLVIVVVFVLVRHRRAKNEKGFGEDDDGLPVLGYAALGSLPSTLNSSANAVISSTESKITSMAVLWDDEAINAARIPFEKIILGPLISRGGYGEVYRGTYRDETVAIKTLLPERRNDMRQIENFLSEVKLMAAMDHERIVRFVGVAWDSLNELCVVSEFLSGGDLRSYLSRLESDRSRPRGFDTEKIKIAWHVAHALTYLHSLQPVVLHRDLKSRNILLDSERNAKLTDFGVSRERADRTMTAGVGSSLWMAPEVMKGERYDEKADVFSFGVVLAELDQHTMPYAHAVERGGTDRRLPDTAILQLVAGDQLRVEFTDADRSEMAQLGLACVRVRANDRPRAAEVLHRVHKLWRQSDMERLRARSSAVNDRASTIV
ncbi:hypothetical protein Poli38472_012417 [Pythium oligandrum]|uniref:Protein kinase domain-containing protein n=1 Tax=Pythium oligandrum TaxID=41045 RepID=A0A8K1CRE9_PYTOL|nr:hypothetical protein Poli38472_012417 [Pythium oligandrum]|eukprot:TMW67301.1 hypothetical protein Poli38472_012417 [Pythium oligandrum]